jgi:hypothetical protein
MRGLALTFALMTLIAAIPEAEAFATRPIADAGTYEGVPNGTYWESHTDSVQFAAGGREYVYQMFNVSVFDHAADAALFLYNAGSKGTSEDLNFSVYYCTDYFVKETLNWANQDEQVSHCELMHTRVSTELTGTWIRVPLPTLLQKLRGRKTFTLKLLLEASRPTDTTAYFQWHSRNAQPVRWYGKDTRHFNAYINITKDNIIEVPLLGDVVTEPNAPARNFGWQVYDNFESQQPNSNLRDYQLWNLSGFEELGNLRYRFYVTKLTNIDENTTLDYEVYFCNDTFDEFNVTYNNEKSEVTNCDTEPVYRARMNSLSLGFNILEMPRLKERVLQDPDRVFTLMWKSTPEDYAVTCYEVIWRSKDYEGTNKPTDYGPRFLIPLDREERHISFSEIVSYPLTLIDILFNGETNL